MHVLARRLAGLIALCGALVIGVTTSAAAAVDCSGDCSGDGRVSIDELIIGVAIALRARPAADCAAIDGDGDGVVSVHELVRAAHSLLSGCDTPSPNATGTPSATADAATVTVTPTATTGATATPRPNFLVIQLDDTRFDGIDRMPTLQRLADEGVRFTQSFVPLPLCAPSRASTLTGLYAVRHGTHRLAGEEGGARSFRVSGADQQTIATTLSANGYVTGLFGKYVNAYAEERDQGSGGGFYVPPGWTRWRAFVVEHYGGRDGTDYELVDETGLRTAYVDHSSDAQYSTDVLAADVRSFIADAVAHERPFFAIWTPYASHIDAPTLVPIPAGQYLGTLSPFAPWRPPSWREDDLTDKPLWLRQLRPPPGDVAFADLARQRAYETLLSVDDALNLLLADLDALGIAERTMVLVTSDNGVAWDEHGLDGGWRKECPYEECLRVPMIVRFPRAQGSVARTADTPVLNIDIAPTVREFAGVPPSAHADGISFGPALQDASAALRDDFLLEHWGNLSVQIAFHGQPMDGDRLRIVFGPLPKQSVSFEFDGDNAVTAASIAVPLGKNAIATFQELAARIAATIPGVTAAQGGFGVSVRDVSTHESLYALEEVDRADAFDITYLIPAFFGVRDVANALTYVEYESGEVELYDLRLDPWQLDNKADDPGYAARRARLAARLRELLPLPEARRAVHSVDVATP